MFWVARTNEKSFVKKESITIDLDKAMGYYDDVFPVCVNFRNQSGDLRIYMNEAQLEALAIQATYLLQDVSEGRKIND